MAYSNRIIGVNPAVEWDNTTPPPTLAIIDEATGVEPFTDEQVASWASRIIHLPIQPTNPRPFYHAKQE